MLDHKNERKHRTSTKREKVSEADMQRSQHRVAIVPVMAMAVMIEVTRSVQKTVKTDLLRIGR